MAGFDGGNGGNLSAWPCNLSVWFCECFDAACRAWVSWFRAGIVARSPCLRILVAWREPPAFGANGCARAGPFVDDLREILTVGGPSRCGGQGEAAKVAAEAGRSLRPAPGLVRV